MFKAQKFFMRRDLFSSPQFDVQRGLFRAGCIALLGFSVLLAGCASSGLSDLSTKVASIGDFSASEPPATARIVPAFVVSTRSLDHKASTDNAAHLSLQMISVPPGHQAGQMEKPMFGAADPNKHFAVTAKRDLDDATFQAEIESHLSGRIGSNRDVLIYVHGFNTSYDDARFRLAQLVTDGRFGGVPVLFTWPASSNLLDYEAAKESAAASRDALAKLLQELATAPGVGRVQIVAHSMGTWLVMEALRETAIAGMPDLNGRLGNVMLAAPDIDLSVFRAQIARLDASHISVLVSANDRALSISQKLAGNRQRVGALDPRNENDRAALQQLGVRVYDLSGESVGFIGHDTYADAPEIVRQLGAQIGAPRLQDANVQSILGEKPVSSDVAASPLPATVPASAATTPGATAPSATPAQ
jgi:esterase/lipase superfamily enzyme